jgi:hypothetical protein
LKHNLNVSKEFCDSDILLLDHYGRQFSNIQIAKAGGELKLKLSGRRRVKNKANKLSRVVSSGSRDAPLGLKSGSDDNNSKIKETSFAVTSRPTSRKTDVAALLNSSVAAGKDEQEEYDSSYDSSHSTEVSKIWTESKGQATSTTTAPEVEVASAELVSLLVEHPNLKDLYASAITSNGQVETREALCLVLKSYAKALKSNARNSQEYKAGELVRSYARRIAYACVALHDPNAPSIDSEGRFEALHRQKVQAAFHVEDYLNNLVNQGNQLPQEQDLESNVADLSDDSDREDIGDPLPNLSKVTAYLTSGYSFDQLRKDILHLSIQMPNYEGPTFLKLQKTHSAQKDAFEHSGSTNDDKVSKTTAICGDFSSEVQRTMTTPPISFFSATVCHSYHVLKSWLGSNFWPTLRPECTRLNWKCVSPLD